MIVPTLLKKRVPYPDRNSLGIATFIIFAFAIPWGGWVVIRQIADGGDQLTATLAFLVLPAGVSLGGFAASYVEGGSVGLGEFAKRTVLARFDPKALLLVLGTPIAAGLLTFASHPEDLMGRGRPDLMIWLGSLTLLNLSTGPLAEEFGWRGYLLAKFERLFPTWLAGLALGPIWTLWHLPLFWDTVFAGAAPFLGYMLWVCAWSVILAMVTKAANGNVLPAVALHLFLNTQADFFSAFLPGLDGSALPSGLPLAVSSFVVAVTVIAWTLRFARPTSA
ncbi:CPBP family intramembrane glutamic endopeptidase [Porphyrobacter sp. CACIAM 03H1]|uniref:CPBP family intramembrane glutamic endopeptidase n=1 Tax=Porphyrobacter sp. CACIAM 03H1 TaxID=2003315 RepID=UPI000B5A739C|nr:CPBP family intramembrane glutamic endopeptidase [Porphyrobacter sp. CACIAM 03H1]ASJ91967.1 hypothetical protein CBR61_14215 [Porphyrobacter sp. CACIAM 03H1]